MAQNPNESATIGTVTAIVGEVKVTGTDGVVRILTAGDTVATGEVIETSANGAVHIQLANGRALECGPRFSGTLNPGLLDLASGTRIALDGSIINPAVAAVPAPGDIATTPVTPGAIPQDIAALQAAIAGGADPSRIAEASAAGGAAPGAGGADGGGGTPLLIEQANSQGQVTSGIDGSGGNPLGFPNLTTEQFGTVQPESPPSTPPVISVDLTGIRLVPPSDPETPPEEVVVSGNIVSLVEGTSPGTDPGKILNFVLVLDKASDVDVEVTYTITALGEQNDIDLVDLLGGTVVVPAGVTQILVPIKISQDHNVEIDDSFELVITSATNATINPNASTAILNIINDDEPPLAQDDAYTVNEGENGTALLPSVLTRTDSGETADDGGADAGETLTVTTTGTIATTQGGHVVMSADGSGTFRYFAPNADFNGTDSFTYKMTDGFNGESQATVTITVASVDDAPVAGDNSYEVNEDTTLDIPFPGVLVNDNIGGDGGTLTPTIVTQPTHGTLTLNPNGSFSYTPTANYNGPDSFTYSIQDVDGDTDTATVSITVKPVDDAPVAGDNSYEVNEDTTLDIPFPGVLVNDNIGGDGGTLTPTIVTQPTHGTLTLNPNGSFSYTPTANYNGPDSFTYSIQDVDGDTDTATVSITVKPVDDAPVAGDNSYEVNEDTTLDIPFPGVLVNDNIGGDGGTLTPTIVTQPTHGTLTLNPNGSFSYTPTANYNGPDSFTYSIQDVDGDTDTATVSITVKPVDEVPSINIPAAGGATTTVYEAGLPARGSEPAGSNSSATTETATGTVTFNSPDGLSLVSLGGHALTGTAQTFSDGLTASYTYTAATGTGTINYSYTLADNTSGNNTVASFPVVVTDTDGDSAPAGNLVINIVDDTPAIISIVNLAAQNNAGAYTGSWVPVTGADGYNSNIALPNVNSAEGINIALSNESSIALIKASSTQDVFEGSNYLGELYTAYLDANQTNIFFTLLMKTDGTYVFNLQQPNPAVTTTETLNLTGAVGGFGGFLYAEKIADFKDYPDPKTDIKFIAHQDYAGGTDLGTTSNVNTNNNGIGVSDSGSGGGIHTALNESLTLIFLKGDADTDGDTHPADSAAQPIDSVKVSFQVAHDNGKDSVNDEVSVRFILHLADGSTETQNAPGTGIADNGSYIVASSSGKQLLSVDVVNVDTDGDTFLLTAADVTVTTTQLPSDLTLNFNAQIVDGDGDVSATAAFTVAVDTNNSISSTPGNTNDIMYGDTGSSNTFAWNLNDTGLDTVVNFEKPSTPTGGDILNLADLLTGIPTAANAGSYLEFAPSGSSDVALTVRAQGPGDTTLDQTIVLKGVTMADLAGTHSVDSAGIIANMLEQSKLIIN